MEAATMVFKVEAKTAIDESRSWVRIAQNRLLALADASDDPATLQAAAQSLAQMFTALGELEARLGTVDEEWARLFQPRPSRTVSHLSEIAAATT
jgi:hypothetical protein